MPLVMIVLASCGGGTADQLPSPLTSAEAAQTLTTSPRAYPAALAVRVTTAQMQAGVRGVRWSGGPTLEGDEAFPMGSMTKSMTATLAGVLVQDGRIEWNSRLADVLPELLPTARPEYAQVTLQDLLSHRGGLYPATTTEQIAKLPELTGSPTQQRLQLADWALQQPSTSQPGVRTQYSNGDYIVAGAMLERAAGLPYETLLQTKVFTPLGATVAFGAPGREGREPWGHEPGGSNAWRRIDPQSPEAQFPAAGNPAGGAKLTGSALARNIQMHLRADRGKTGEVLAPETAKTLHTIVQDGFALGWQDGSDLEGARLLWHNGSDDLSYYGLMAMSRTRDVASAVVVTGLSARTEADASEVTLRLLR